MLRGRIGIIADDTMIQCISFEINALIKDRCNYCGQMLVAVAVACCQGCKWTHAISISTLTWLFRFALECTRGGERGELVTACHLSLDTRHSHTPHTRLSTTRPGQWRRWQKLRTLWYRTKYRSLIYAYNNWCPSNGTSIKEEFIQLLRRRWRCCSKPWRWQQML